MPRASWRRAADFWALSRFDDVLDGYRDWETYTSTLGIALGDAGLGTTPSMIGTDPPDRTKLRKLAVHATNVAGLATLPIRFTPSQPRGAAA